MLAAFSTRNAIILAALSLGAIAWGLDALMLAIFEGVSVLDALIPGGESRMRRIFLASAIGFTAAGGCSVYANALRNEMIALAEFDLQYRSALEATLDSVITVDSASRIVDVNTAAGRSFATTPSALINRHVDDLIAAQVDELGNANSQDWTHLSADPASHDASYRVTGRRFNGTTFPAEMHALPITYRNEVHRILILREVTEQVMAEKALKRSEARYRDLFEQTPDGVFRADYNGRILAANEAMVKILRYDSEVDLRKGATVQKIIHRPDQADQLFHKLNNNGEIREITVDLLRKDGSVGTVRANIMAIPTDDDTSRWIYQGTVADVTALSAATDALRDSEEHFRALTENALDIITVIDENAEVLYCSPSSFGITGFRAGEHVGANVFSRIHEDDLARVRELVHQGFSNPGTPEAFAFRYHHKDGSVLHMESVGRTFVSSRGELRGVINTRDITERRQTSQQLQQAQKMQAIGQLTGGVAHDFNNLLTVIVGNLQLIDEQIDACPESKQQLDTALRAAMQGADLTRRLLAFARRQPLEPKVLHAGELISGMESLLQRSLGESMSLSVEIAKNLWLAKVDPTQLESAILNLAINSRDATDGQGRLLIVVSNRKTNTSSLLEKPLGDTNDFVCVSVRDDGTGMPDDVRKSAIEPFFTTKNGSNGSGLGLSMVYGFVKQTGGYMQLQSEPGRGTVIDLYLPRAAEEKVDRVKLTTDHRTPNGKETVLVVDDHRDVRSAAVATITRLGYEVLDASSGPAALRVLKSQRVDLLFSDIKMPEMSGFELASRCRDDFPSTRILLTSGFTDGSSFSENSNSFEFLRKPYNKHELATKIRNILDEVSN